MDSGVKRSARQCHLADGTKYNGFVNKDGLVFGWHRRERNVS